LLVDRESSVTKELYAFGSVADFLCKIPPSEQSRSLLIKLLAREESYVVDGDFYGRDGEWRVVGDGAALAVVQHNEVAALSNWK